MDLQLRYITNLLNAKDIDYWIDSGTLLGIVRNGDIILGDNDIDIGIWSKSINELKNCLQTISKHDYRLLSQCIGGLTFKIILIPRQSKSLKRIDFHIYRRCSNYAWSPSYIIRANKYSKKSIKYYFTGLIKHLLLLMRNINRKIANSESLNSILLYYILDIKTWWIPSDFFEQQIYLEKHKLFVPMNYNNYLTFRYGNWHQVNKKWNYWIDDRGLKKKDIISLVNNNK